MKNLYKNIPYNREAMSQAVRDIKSDNKFITQQQAQDIKTVLTLTY